MKRPVAGLALGILALAALMVPTHAQAARNIWLQRAQQESLAASVSPSDPEALELLKILEIKADVNDPIWSDFNFVSLVLKYKEIRSLGLDLVGGVGDLVLMAFDLQDIGGRINDERFQPFFSLTDEDRAMQEQLRLELQANIEAFKTDPEAFLEEFMSGFENGLQSFDNLNFEDPSYDPNAPYAYGYSDPAEYLETGRVVWLFSDSYNPLESDMTVTWTQTGGPDVTWLNTTSKSDVAFIMPSFDGYEGEPYLTFDITADNGQSSSSYTVYVDWLQPNDSEVADAFYDIMGYEIDIFHSDYWQAEFDSGMSMEQIRAHFELYREYGLPEAYG